MSTFDDLERALGIDMSDPREVLARDLVEADHELLEELVRLRKNVLAIPAARVAERMGRDRAVVTNFEKLTADPHLSTIRRYALAIGAKITHHVELIAPPTSAPPRRETVISGVAIDVNSSGTPIAQPVALDPDEEHVAPQPRPRIWLMNSTMDDATCA
jgi:hypothetical protein